MHTEKVCFKHLQSWRRFLPHITALIVVTIFCLGAAYFTLFSTSSSARKKKHEGAGSFLANLPSTARDQLLCPVRSEIEHLPFVPYKAHVGAIIEEEHGLISRRKKTTNINNNYNNNNNNNNNNYNNNNGNNKGNVAANKAGRKAFVTFVSSRDYVLPAAVLMHSVARTQSSHFRAVCVSKHLDVAAREALSVFAQVIEIDTLPSPFYIDIPRYIDTLTKLRLWQLDMFEKIVYLDVDIAVTKNIDDLFESTAATSSGAREGRGGDTNAVPTSSWGVPMDGDEPNRISSGMMVIEPSVAIFDRMRERLATASDISMVFPDLNFLQAFFAPTAAQKRHFESYRRRGNNNNSASSNHHLHTSSVRSGEKAATAASTAASTASEEDVKTNINKFPRWYQVYQSEFSGDSPTYMTQRRSPLSVFDPRVRGIHYPGSSKPWHDLDKNRREYGHEPTLCCFNAHSERHCEMALPTTIAGADGNLLSSTFISIPGADSSATENLYGFSSSSGGDDDNDAGQLSSQPPTRSAHELWYDPNFVWSSILSLMLQSMRRFVAEHRLEKEYAAAVNSNNNNNNSRTLRPSSSSSRSRRTTREFETLSHVIFQYTARASADASARNKGDALWAEIEAEVDKSTAPLLSVFAGDNDRSLCSGRGFIKLPPTTTTTTTTEKYKKQSSMADDTNDKSNDNVKCYCEIGFQGPRCQLVDAPADSLRISIAISGKLCAQHNVTHDSVTRARTALLPKLRAALGFSRGEAVVASLRYRFADGTTTVDIRRGVSDGSNVSSNRSEEDGFELDLVALSQNVAARIGNQLTPQLFVQIASDPLSAAYVNLRDGFSFCRFAKDEPNNADENENFLQLVLVQPVLVANIPSHPNSTNTASSTTTTARRKEGREAEEEDEIADDYSSDDQEVDSFRFGYGRLPIFIDTPVQPVFMDFPADATATATICEIVCAAVDHSKQSSSSNNTSYNAIANKDPMYEEYVKEEKLREQKNNLMRRRGLRHINSTFIFYDHQKRNWAEARAVCEKGLDLSGFSCGRSDNDDDDGPATVRNTKNDLDAILGPENAPFVYSRLPRIRNDADAAAVADLIKGQPGPWWGADARCWTGATDDGDEGHFRWEPEGEAFCSVGSRWIP